MKIILGVDVGTSSTKIAAIDENKNIIKLSKASASDQMTSLFGAIGRILYELKLETDDVEKIMMTGIGAAFVKGDLLGIPTQLVTEFDSISKGCLYLTGKKEGLVLGLGTGSVLVHATEEKGQHAGGSAVGGGTVIGLGKRLFGISKMSILHEMAMRGDVANVDWGIAELNNISAASAGLDTDAAYSSTIPAYATSSNLGKMLPTASDEDVIRGIFNMVYQTVGTLAVFSARNYGYSEVIVSGGMSENALAKIMLGYVGILYGIDFVFCENASYATVIGAALLAF